MTVPPTRPGRPHAGRPRFTGRAAILAVVLCAIVLSLAYPVREYISQRRQIDQLRAQQVQIALRMRILRAQRGQLTNPLYIEQQARDQLHMCLPTQMCYIVIGAWPADGRHLPPRATSPWYQRLWSSVQQADVRRPATDRTPGGRPARPRTPGG